jgi:hypothetical protein
VIAIEPGEQSKDTYTVFATQYGDSTVIVIPSERRQHLGLDKLKEDDGPDRIPLFLQEETGPKGDYDSLWNPDFDNSDNH